MLGKTNPLFITLYLLSLTLLNSCKKDDQSARIGQTNSTCQVTKFYNSADPTKYSIFQYNNQDKPITANGFDQGKEKSLQTYEYDQKGQVSKLTTRNNILSNGKSITTVREVTFEYNSTGQISKYVTVYTTPDSDPNYKHTLQTTCEYDTEGNRIKTSETPSVTTGPYVSIFSYQNGNCIKAIYGQGSAYERIEEHEYYMDQENKQKQSENAYSQINLTEKSSSKNMIKKTTLSYKQTPSENGSVTYSHEFNDKGFPTKHVIIYTTKTTSTTLINIVEYKCQ